MRRDNATVVVHIRVYTKVGRKKHEKRRKLAVATKDEGKVVSLLYQKMDKKRELKVLADHKELKKRIMTQCIRHIKI